MKNRLKKLFNMNEKDEEILEKNEHQDENASEELSNSETTNESNVSEEDSKDNDLQKLQKELEEAKQKYTYLYSDFENFRRNTAKERVEMIQGAGRDIMAALLPILDDFDRADKNDGLSEGTKLIVQKLRTTLKAKHLREMEIEVGAEFNADQQEAIANIPAPSDDLKGKIVDVVEKGYFLGDKIIRHAKVVVGN